MTEFVMTCPNLRCARGRLVEVGIGEYTNDTDMGPCPDCKGEGTVPDVIGQLQAKVEQLTADLAVATHERDAWRETHQRTCDSYNEVLTLLNERDARMAELTKDRDCWKSIAQREPPETPNLLDTLHTGYYAGALQGDMDGFLWMMATDAVIQGTYATFYRNHPEYQRGYWNYENASAAAGMLADFVDQYSELVEEAVKLAGARGAVDRLTAQLAERSADLATALGEVERLTARERAGRSASDKSVGLYGKFAVSRCDGSTLPGGKHEKCFFFVLDMHHDKAARPALAAYAVAVRAEGYDALADDLDAWLAGCKP